MMAFGNGGYYNTADGGPIQPKLHNKLSLFFIRNLTKRKKDRKTYLSSRRISW